MVPYSVFSLCGAEQSGPPRRLKSVQVLIVDDHPIIVSGCRALLKAEPEIQVIEAQDGAGGFAAYFDNKPFSFSASLTLSLKPPGITISPGFWSGLQAPSHFASIVVTVSIGLSPR